MKKYEYMLIINEHRRFYENGDITTDDYKKAVAEITEKAWKDPAISDEDYVYIFVNADSGMGLYTWWKGEEKIKTSPKSR